jgi:colanic acid biosynthesis glycosyl transferase WcaI
LAHSLSAVGMGGENSFLHRVLGKIAGFLYRKAARIVVVTPAFKQHLIQHWHLPGEKISIVENGVESSLFSPGATREPLRSQLGLSGRFVVAYIGTMGMAHGLDTLIEAASALQSSESKISFLLVGEGADKERIRGAIRSRSLSNICIVDQQPREAIPAYICASDVCLVLLKKTDLFKTVIPTKMLEFMSCARPVILGVDGQARQILEEARGGVAIEPENASALTDAIKALAGDESLRRALGANARAYIVDRCSREQSANNYITLLEELVQEPE